MELIDLIDYPALRYAPASELPTRLLAVTCDDLSASALEARRGTMHQQLAA